MRSCRWCRKLTQSALGVLALILFAHARQDGIAQQVTIRTSIPVPPGFTRNAYSNGSFSHWIQHLGLKNPPVIRDYRGEVVRSDFYTVWGVVQMPLLFRSDLEQCADFAMRLWAEYHKAAGKLDRLYLFDYDGNRRQFKSSGKSYLQFLKAAFANTNSHSLKKGCKTVAAVDVAPGDLIVQNERGGIGHVSVIMDACRSNEGKRLFLIGYSFMPAQEFHIEKARDRYGVNGWFTLDGYRQYLADFLNYGEPELRRFDPL